MSTGKGSKSIRKSQQGLDLLPSVGFLNTVAKHKATLGQTVINLGSLSVPTEATSLGFIQPSGGTLAAIDLQRFKNNVSLRSSVRGLMDNPIDYQVTGTQQITLSVAALENEIFTIIVESRPATTVQMVAAQPKVESYTLPAGQTDIPTGPYTVNKNAGQRVGDFMVIVDRQVMYRNDGNSAWSSGIVGDYQELPGIVRLNFADLGNDRDVVLVWVGALVDNPQDSQLALVQTLGGQIDAMIPVLAALSGLPQSQFQAAPNDVDLLNFGADVIDHEARITALEAAPAFRELHLDTGNGSGSTGTRIRRFSNIRSNTLGSAATYADSATDGMSVTINEAGTYECHYSDFSSAGAISIGISVNAASLSANLNSPNTSYAQGKRCLVNTPGANLSNGVTVTLNLIPGDVVRAHSGGVPTGITDDVIFRMVKVR